MKKTIIILLVMILTLGMSATTVFAGSKDVKSDGKIFIDFPDELATYNFQNGKPVTFDITVRTTADFDPGNKQATLKFGDRDVNGVKSEYPSDKNSFPLTAGVNTYNTTVTVTSTVDGPIYSGLYYAYLLDYSTTSGPYVILTGKTTGGSDNGAAGNTDSNKSKNDKSKTDKKDSATKDTGSKNTAATCPKTADTGIDTFFVFINVMVMLAAVSAMVLAIRLKRQ